MQRQLDREPLCVALDLDQTAVATHEKLHTYQFLSYPVIWFMKILQSQYDLSYSIVTHRGIDSVGRFYVHSIYPLLNKFVDEYNNKRLPAERLMDLDDYYTYRIVENIERELNQPAAGISTSDDRVFLGEVEVAAKLGSGYTSLMLYEKEYCTRFEILRKSNLTESSEIKADDAPLEKFKRDHPTVQITPLNKMTDKNSQLTSIAIAYVKANEVYLARNPGKKLQLLVIDDVERISTDALLHAKTSKEWPPQVELSAWRMVNPPFEVGEEQDLIKYLQDNKRHIKAVNLATWLNAGGATYTFQPFFVKVELSRENKVLYRGIRAASALRDEWEKIEIPRAAAPASVSAAAPAAPAPAPVSAAAPAAPCPAAASVATVAVTPTPTPATSMPLTVGPIPYTSLRRILASRLGGIGKGRARAIAPPVESEIEKDEPPSPVKRGSQFFEPFHHEKPLQESSSNDSFVASASDDTPPFLRPDDETPTPPFVRSIRRSDSVSSSDDERLTSGRRGSI